MSTFREESRGNFTSAQTIEHINAGSFQRIADACEKMAENHDELNRKLRSAEDSLIYWRQWAEKLEHRVRGLRSRITLLKRKSVS